MKERDRGILIAYVSLQQHHEQQWLKYQHMILLEQV
jgi:hypothetical protein